MEDFKGIKEAVYAAKNITVLTSDNPGQDPVGAAMALFFSLKNINKIVNLPSVPKIPRPIAAAAQRPGQKTFLISLKKDIAEIYYEKKDGEMKLYLKPKKEEIRLEDLSFKTIVSHDAGALAGTEELKDPADLLIAVGMENFHDIEKEMEENPAQYLPQIKIINIDNNSLNQKYADFNLIKDYPSLSQSCAYFLRNINPDLIGENAATSLLYGITPLLENQKISPAFLSWLAKKGADFSSALEKNPLSPAGQALLVEAFKKMELCEGKKVYFSALAEKNFGFANASSKDLGPVVDRLKTSFAVPSLLLLWEGKTQDNAKKIMGIFYSSEKDLSQKISQRFEGLNKGNGVLFSAKDSDLLSARKNALDAIGCF